MGERRWFECGSLIGALLLVGAVAAGLVARSPVSLAEEGTPSPDRFVVAGDDLQIVVYRVELQPGATWESPDARHVQVTPVVGTVLVSSGGGPWRPIGGHGGFGGGGGPAGPTALRNESDEVAAVELLLIGSGVGNAAGAAGVAVRLLGGGEPANPVDLAKGLTQTFQTYERGPIDQSPVGYGQGFDLGRDSWAMVVVTDGALAFVREAGVVTATHHDAAGRPRVERYDRGGVKTLELQAGDAVFVDQGAGFALVTETATASTWMVSYEPNTAAAQEIEAMQGQ